MFVLFAIGGGVYAYLELKKTKRPSVSAVSIIPDSCLVYACTGDLFELNKKINRQSLIAEQLKLVPDIGDFLNNLDQLENKLSSTSTLSDAFKGNKIHAALYDKGWLLCMNVKTSGKQSEVMDELKRLFLADGGDQDYPALQFNGIKNLILHAEDGIISVSNSKELLAGAWNKTGSKLQGNNEFKSYQLLLEGEQPFSLYIDHKRFASSPLRKKLNLTYLVKSGSSCSNLSSSPAELSLNGILRADSSEKMCLVKGEDPIATSEIIRDLPSNVVFLEAFSCGKQKKLKPLFLNNKTTTRFWHQVDEKAMYSLKNDFYDNMTGALISFENASKTTYARITVKDTAKVREHLRLMSDTLISRDSVTIYRFFSDVKQGLFQPLTDIKVKAALQTGNDVYFAAETQDLVYLISFIRTRTFLTGDEKFAQYVSRQIPEQSQYLLYASPVMTYHQENRFFNLATSDTAFKNIKHVSFSALEQNNDFRFRFQVTHETGSPFKQNLWFTELDTVSALRPMAFVNHLTGEKEIVVQDAANRLYLVNPKGQILWRKKLTEQMTSPLHIVDVFGNKKLQMLFSTKNYIHLVDRNGNYVEGFPVKLPAPSTNPLTVFDYDNNHDYRMFIACSNNMIYNFSMKGRITEGFVPVRTANKVRLPVQYTVIGEGHYLIGIDEDGKIYAFSRKGIEKVTFRNRSIANCKGFYVDPSRLIDKSYIIYVDEKNNLLNKISFADKKEIVELHKDFPPAHIRFQKVDENMNTDLLISSGVNIVGYDFSGEKLVDEKLKESLSESELLRDENDYLLYALNDLRTQLYIKNLNSNKVENVEASSLPLVTDLFGKNKKYLVYISGSRLSCRDIQ